MGVQKLCRVAEPTPEVEIAEGAPTDAHKTAGGMVTMEAGEAGKDDEEVREIPEHIVDMVARSVKGWSHPQQQAIKGLLIKHAEVFSKDEFDIGRMDLFKHEIDTGDAKTNQKCTSTNGIWPGRGWQEDNKQTSGKRVDLQVSLTMGSSHDLGGEERWNSVADH